MHALRQHCGSFYSEILQQQWLTDEEREELQQRKKTSKLSLDKRASPTGQLDSMAKQLSAGPTDESKRLSAAFGDDSKMVTAGAPPVESVISVQCAPKEWPLFNAPNLSSLRVTGFKEKGGTMVSAN